MLPAKYLAVNKTKTVNITMVQRNIHQDTLSTKYLSIFHFYPMHDLSFLCVNYPSSSHKNFKIIKPAFDNSVQPTFQNVSQLFFNMKKH